MKQETKISVSIVVLNYNSDKFYKKLSQSVLGLKFDSWEIIIVDNNSQDNSFSHLRQELRAVGRAVFIKNKENLGFAKANNLAARRARGKYLFFINCDLWLHPNSLHHLYTAAENSNGVGIYVPLQRTYDGTGVISCGVGIDLWGFPAVSKNKNKFFYADGAALFIDAKTFWELRAFDEVTFFTGEDIGLSWRARLFGKIIRRVPEAIVYHWSGGIMTGGAKKKNQQYQTSYRRRYFTERNILRNLLIHYRLLTLLWLVPLLLIIHFFESLTSLFFFGGQAFWVYPKSWYWNIKNGDNIRRWRKFVQSERKESDLEIIKNMMPGYNKIKALRKTGLPIYSKQ